MVWSAEKEQDACSRNPTDWKIDIEAPMPGNRVYKDPSEQRTDNTGDTEDSTDAANNRRYLLRSCDERGDCVTSQVRSGPASALNRAPNNEGGAVRCQSTDEAANFEDADGGEKAAADREVVVAFPPERLESR